MPEKTIEIQLNYCGSRNEVRMRAVQRFSEEEPGNGTNGDASKYHYVVKKLKNDKQVILTRPANLKNGFDFLIRVKGYNFAPVNKKKRDYPRHDEIINDLMLKKNSNPTLYEKLYSIINKIYECKNINDTELEAIDFNKGFPVDMIVCVIRWFFIEQDIRYWNYSGRRMLMSKIPKP